MIQGNPDGRLGVPVQRSNGPGLIHRGAGMCYRRPETKVEAPHPPIFQPKNGKS